MPLFSPNKASRVKSFILKLVNNNCPELLALRPGRRLDSRVNLVVVVLVVPLENGRIKPEQAFTAITKEFSNIGVALVLDRTSPLSQAIIGFRFEGEMTYLLGEVRHFSPLGGGFFQLGFRLLEVACPADYPGLEELSL